MDILNTFRAVPWFYIGTFFVFGLAVGSFLNVVIHRLPKMLEARWKDDCMEFLHPEEFAKSKETPRPKYNLVVPRSACPSCGHKISALENIPVVSYLALRGKCRACKTPISLRYPIIETVTGVLTALVAWHFGVSWAALFAAGFLWALIALTVIDADHKYLPDDITLPLLWAGLLANVGSMYTDLTSAVIGAVVGYMLLWLVNGAFKLLRGQDGMGFGDFKLLAAMGAWLGWQMLPLVILLSAAVGTVVGLYGIFFKGRDSNYKLPFGPYIAAAGFIGMIWGTTIMVWYLQTGRVPA
ncbi:MAG: prepilin peptidase [Betaproteobacteria bacterium]|nr:prepilin peptidase [Betaproteobacteria bacterium]